jgi:rubredoxin
MALWKCSVCGYIHDGNGALEKCPKCGAPKSAFKMLNPSEEQLVLKARKTNEMHIAISGFYAKVEKWAVKIKAENLDPNCVAIADRIIKDTLETKQAIKAELEAHMNKGKWG